MDRIRSLPRGALAVIGASAYLVVWWSAILGALWLAWRRADPGDEPSLAEVGFGVIGVAMYFTVFAMLGFVLANAIWVALVEAIVPDPAHPVRLTASIAIVAAAGLVLPIIAARTEGAVAWVVVLAGTFAVPGVCTWWLAAPPARPAEQGGRG